MIAIKLYAHQLRGIADAIDNLQGTKGIKITTFQYNNLTITVDETSDQMDGRSLFVTDIRDSTKPEPLWNLHHGTVRDGTTGI